MKKFTHFVCLLLIVAMVLAIPVFAEERASSFFSAHSCYLWELSDSEFQVCFNVTATGAMEVLGASEIKVQRSTDKTNWTTVATYNDFYGYNRSYYSDEVTYSSATSGYYYRGKVTFYAKKGNGIAEYIAYTSYI